MSFDKLAEQANELQEKQQSETLFRLIGKLNAHYTHQLNERKVLTKEEAITLIRDSLEEA